VLTFGRFLFEIFEYLYTISDLLFELYIYIHIYIYIYLYIAIFTLHKNYLDVESKREAPH